MTETLTTGDQLLQDAEARLAAIEETSREVAAITAVARTPDGHSSVTVGAGGSVRSIDLTAESFRSSPAQLGSALVAAIAAATGDVARQGAVLLAERTGIDITERIAAAQVLAGDPVAVAAEHNADGRVSCAPIEEDEGEQDWLWADGR
ncbi:MAG: hypothetical protein ACXVXJ_10640 [Mycobacteriaceae bacterium]